jgi:hypothetical protein
MSNPRCGKLGFGGSGLWFMANAVVAEAGLPYYWDPQWENCAENNRLHDRCCQTW